MNDALSMDKYTPLWVQNPMLASKKIFGCGLFTQGVRAIANTVFGYYYNYRKASQNNKQFYDPKCNDYYIICENKVVRTVFNLSCDALNKAKKLLKDIGLINPVPQPWNRPDRIYIGSYTKISKSMTSKKSSFKRKYSKMSGDLKCRSLHTENNTSKIIYNNNYTVTTPKPLKKSKSNKTKVNNHQNVSALSYSMTNTLDTKHTKKSKHHAKELSNDIIRIGGKDSTKAYQLFHMLSSLTKTYLVKHNHIHGFRLENLPSFGQFLQHVYETQLRPDRKLGFKYNAFDKNYIKKCMKNFLGRLIDNYKYINDNDYRSNLDKVSNWHSNFINPVDPKEAVDTAKQGELIDRAIKREKQGYNTNRDSKGPNIPIFKI